MSKDELIAKMIREGILRSKSIIAAFEKIDRVDFVSHESKGEAYEDYPLPIGYGQTISQPSTVAFMLELLEPKAGEKILDVGSGSGWTTALLAQIVGPTGRVWGLELVPELVKFGSANLARYNFSHAEIRQAHSTSSGQAGNVLGLPQEAPLDKILVSAAGDEMPQELINQLKVGGRLVIPIQNSVWRVDKVSDTEVKEEEFPGFVFVPLR